MIRPSYASAYFNRGTAYLSLGQHQPGLQDFNEAIRLAPANADAHTNRGFALLNLGFADLSINDYNQAIELKPEAYVGRALAYTVLGRDAEAAEDLARATELGVEQAFLDEVLEEVKNLFAEAAGS